MTAVLTMVLAASPVDGLWVPHDVNANQAIIDRAIEQASEAFPWVLRPLARARLRETNPLFPTIIVQQDQTSLTCRTPPVVARTTSGTGFIIGLDGERSDLSHELAGPSLTQVTSNASGRRRTRFEVSPDGDHLEVAVEVTSPHLRAPLKYLLRYRRAVHR